VTTERIYLTVAEVVAIHRHQIEEYGGEHGLLNQGALESAVFRPQTGYYNGLSEEAAALLESLVNNHPFLEVNDRVGFCSRTYVPPCERIPSERHQRRCLRVHEENNGRRQVPLRPSP
jgi:death-on-curing protein